MYIVATISINSYSAEKIEEILRAGAEVLRYNFSHGTPVQMEERINVAKGVIDRLGLNGKVKILADLPGNKIRLGDMPMKQYPVREGEEFNFQYAETTPDVRNYVPVNLPHLTEHLSIGQIFTLGDGEIAFKVAEIIDRDRFRAHALIAGIIPSMKGINIGRGIDGLNHFIDATISHLQHLRKTEPDWVAFSFVNSAGYLQRAKELLKTHCTDSWQPRIVAKIETSRAVENIDEIAQECDIVLVARGDLGLLCPIEQLGINQKKIVRAAKAAGKHAIVSTQILDSLLEWYVPKRSDVLDLTNIIFDGADGIMLAQATGVSLTPGRSVQIARQIIEAVERDANTLRNFFHQSSRL